MKIQNQQTSAGTVMVGPVSNMLQTGWWGTRLRQNVTRDKQKRVRCRVAASKVKARFISLHSRGISLLKILNDLELVKSSGHFIVA